ncbi:MAG: YceI family protein [Flavobacterium sp.]|nr:MAG: YceI family protein [Flavobacterium sp.]
MKKRVSILLLSSVLALGVSCKKDNAADAEVNDAAATTEVSAESQKYTVDAAGSTIEWKASKPTGNHNGTIGLSNGEISVKDGNLEAGKFTIDMKSITVTDLKAGDGKEDLESHLKGLGKDDADHFFNINKYPTGTFEMTGSSKEGEKTMIEGNLTLKGVTKNIKFPATVTIAEDAVTIVSETFNINRTLWNINYSSKSVIENLGDKYINDDIEIKVNLKAKK